MYKLKSAEQQRKDKEQLSLWQRIDRNEYFEMLQSLNKLEGVTTWEQINEADRTLSGIRAFDLGKNPIEGNFDAAHLCKIHEYLFQDIYYFAGQFRDVDMEIDSVTRFTPARSLKSEASRIFGSLKKDNFFKGLPKSEFCDKLASFMTDLNKLHPFREGNGRSKRIFVSQLAWNAGWELNWSAVSKDEWKYADECAFDSMRDYGTADTTYLKINLHKAIAPCSESRNEQKEFYVKETISINDFLKPQNQNDAVNEDVNE